SATTMTALRLAAEQPERVTHLIAVGGYAQSLVDTPAAAEQARAIGEAMRTDWARYLDGFFSKCFTEPHSTKAFEDGVRYGWATTGAIMEKCRSGWLGCDVRGLARQVRCPTLVIHGDADKRVPHEYGKEIHQLVPGSRMLTIGGGGHLPSVRDPAIFNRSL